MRTIASIVLLVGLGCGDPVGESLGSTPIDPDLEILGVEYPLGFNWPFSPIPDVCLFGDERFRSPDPLMLRVFNEGMGSEPGGPPDPASPHRSIPVRVQRGEAGSGGPDRTLRLIRATARWFCSQWGNGTLHGREEEFGIDPDWPLFPLELAGLDRPFCGPDLDEVTEFELEVAPLELPANAWGTAWVEILSPADRRRLLPYVDISRLAGPCMHFPGGLAPSSEPLEEVNPPHCARLVEAHRRHFGPDEPPMTRPTHAFRYVLRAGKGWLNVRPEITLHFEDDEGFSYPVAAEFSVALLFIDTPFYGSGFVPRDHLCYERPLSEISDPL